MTRDSMFSLSDEALSPNTNLEITVFSPGFRSVACGPPLSSSQSAFHQITSLAILSQGSDGTLKCWDNEMEDCRGEDAREFDSAWNHANSSQDPVLEAAQCAKTIMKWQAPPPLAYKINVDGAWAKESGNGSINVG